MSDMLKQNLSITNNSLGSFYLEIFHVFSYEFLKIILIVDDTNESVILYSIFPNHLTQVADVLNF